MGAYSAWLDGVLRADGRLTADITPARTLAVSDFAIPQEVLEDRLGGAPRVLLLPAPPQRPIPGSTCNTFQPVSNPLRWEGAVDDLIRREIDTAAFFLPPGEVRGKTLLRLRQLGVRRVLFPGRGRFRATSPLLLALARRAAGLGRQIAGMPEDSLSRPMSEGACRAILRQSPPRRRVDADAPLRIAHFVTSLASGGAERQVCIAAALQKRQGHDVRVLTRLGIVGEHAHYRFLLHPHDVTARLIGSEWDERFPEAWRRSGLQRRLFRGMPPDLARQVMDLAGELLSDPVDVLHCYVDDCNVPGAIAAVLSGTPAVVLSFRNGNPLNFPALLRPWMRPWYRATAGSPGLRLSANSEKGARDYEDWLGLAGRSVPVVRNAFVPPDLPTRDEVSSWRRGLGISAEAPVVSGVFRLHPEKRPLYFLECVNRLRQIVPGLRVVIAGVGVMEAEVRRAVEAFGLSATVTMLGQRRDVATILSGSDVTLLVSDWEGTPNVILEAQHCECVPVATDAGGSAEAMQPNVTGLLVSLKDLEGTVRALAGLLHDPARRQRMADAGRAFVTARFAPEALYKGNDLLYRNALSDR